MSRDLIGLLKGLTSQTWKTAPQVQKLASYGDLFSMLFEVARNTVILHSVLVAALMGCGHGEKIARGPRSGVCNDLREPRCLVEVEL
jgi:hypothetical protein